ncbi:MAG: hypothetical protein U5N86_07915 [Planctomycetota bacterium]|nr:hypothetical protein [Planctomycetota bacterium]
MRRCAVYFGYVEVQAECEELVVSRIVVVLANIGRGAVECRSGMASVQFQPVPGVLSEISSVRTEMLSDL